MDDGLLPDTCGPDPLNISLDNSDVFPMPIIDEGATDDPFSLRISPSDGSQAGDKTFYI